MGTMVDIEALEHRYQVLCSDFQTGKIDEATFIAEVDRLQFQDSYDRYWMIGTQTGAWHYYDGQTWHQADPREADQLPFMDDQGRYWQRGVKSGDWYYYHLETGEWVKPSQDDDPAPPPAYGEQQKRRLKPQAAPYQSRLQPQDTDAGPGMPSQLDGQLFQDDEGRYWAVGGKTGQWYFYAHDGWHPAHEFQPTAASQTPQTQSYQPQTYQSPPAQASYQPFQGYPAQPYQRQGPQGYVAHPQPQQPVYQQPAPGPQPTQTYPVTPGQEVQPPGGQSAQNYGVPPQQFPYQQPAPGPQQQPPQSYVAPSEQKVQPPLEQQPVQPDSVQSQPATQTPPPADVQTETAAKPTSSEPDVPQMPKPPQDGSQSGAWYYFDGKQWLKYSSGEPEETSPPPPKMVIDQEAKPVQAKVEPNSQSVVAEFFEEDDEPPVEEVVDVEVITVIEAEPDTEPEQVSPPQTFTQEPRSSAPPPTEDVRPRRSTRPVSVSRDRPEPAQPQRQPRERTSTEPGRPVVPRKKEPAHEPTIIIPTGATASRISSPGPSPVRVNKSVRPDPVRQRRARENTLPMEPMPPQNKDSAALRHREVTQAMPVAASAAPRSDTAQMRAATLARQATKQTGQAVSAASASQSTEVQSEKTGYTFGDVLRALPSTIWTFVGGVVLLLICALGLIFTWSWLQGEEFSPGGLVTTIQSPTPTLDAGPPDATPTPGPTSTPVPELDATTPTTVSVKTFSSPALGFTLEYPEDWEQKEDALWAAFSPSADGLDPDNIKDAALWLGIPADNSSSISDLLTGVLANFPPDAETLNEGTISIASQTWTSAQIRFNDENLGGQGIATLAVTNKDGVGYYLVAVAPAEAWNSVQPSFQGMINSFRFSTEAVAQATPQESEEGAEEEEDAPSSDSTRQPTPAATTAPDITATPLTYIVQSGDTLLGIATKFGVDVDLLASENNIENPESLQVGQELIIPFTAEELAAYNAGGGGEVAPADTSEANSEIATTGTDDETTPEESPAAAPTTSDEPKAASDEPAPVSGRIAYAAFNPGTNIYDLWLADLATGEQSVIAGEASQPAFNKDGSLLAYRSWRLDSRGVFFRDFVGGRGGQVTRFVEDGLPTWSPDGFTFAFASRKEGDRVPRIYIGNQLAEDPYSIGFQGEYPATFPDGRLVVKGCLPTGDCGIFIMGATGGGETKISAEPFDTAPAVSPDGSKIVFMSSGRGATNWEIWVMNADGSNPQRLTENGSNEGLPAWSPDGQSIAYVSDQGGLWAIWVMNADGSNQRKIVNMMGSPDGYVLHDKDNSRGWLEERISWAP